MNLSLNTVLVRETDLSVTEVDGRAVVLSLKAASYFDLNKVASEIWSMLSTPRSVEDILRELSRHHNVDTQTLTRDVMNFLQSLLAQQLVRTVAAEAIR